MAILKKNKSNFLSFLSDTSAMQGGHAEGIFVPKTYDEVSEILKEATIKHWQITISGAGTGTTGARIPFGGFIMSMHFLNRLINIDYSKKIAIVQAGVTLKHLQNCLEGTGLFYPPDPTEKLCFLGSTIANNSSGARSYKFGSTRNYVIGLKIALSSGDILDIQRGKTFADRDGFFHVPLNSGKTITLKIPTYQMPKTKKHVAGYYAAPNMDLIDLFIGSEGTLGVILEATLKLISSPERILMLVVPFNKELKMLSFASELKKPHHSNILSIEFFDKNALKFMKQKGNKMLDLEGKDSIFIIEESYDIIEENEVLIKWNNLLTDFNISDALVARSQAEQNIIRDLRHYLPAKLSEWFMTYKEKKISTDMCVPDEMFEKLFYTYKEECKKENLNYVLFGHIGDSHLHLNILPRNIRERKMALKIYNKFVKKTVELGGTISAEHGIGKIKAKYLSEMYSNDQIQEMIQIKKTLDPAWILNKGNLFSV